jgi:hypothetical protein
MRGSVRVYSIAILFGIIAPATVAAQQLRYVVHDLGMLSSRTSSRANALAEAGDSVVGQFNVGYETSLPCFWSGSLSELPLLSGHSVVKSRGKLGARRSDKVNTVTQDA